MQSNGAWNAFARPPIGWASTRRNWCGPTRGDIRGLGNRLRHGYDRLDLDVLWHTVCHELPELAAAVRQTLQRLQTTPEPTPPAKTPP